MIRPLFAFSICGRTARDIRIGAVALTARKRFHCSGVTSQKRIGLPRWSARISACPMPALFTRTSIRPNALRVSATIVSKNSGLARSAATGLIAAGRVPSAAALRSTATTSNPASDRPRAITRPMPLAAPVTMAVFRCAGIVGSSRPRVCGERAGMPNRAAAAVDGSAVGETGRLPAAESYVMSKRALQHASADSVLEGDRVEVQQQSDLAATEVRISLQLSLMQWQDTFDGLDLQNNLVAHG